MRKFYVFFSFSILLLFTLTACNSTENTSAPKEVDDNEKNVAVVEDELEVVKNMFEPLGDIPIPEDNPMTDEKIELGKMLYFDNRLSGNNQMSCMTCHIPTAGYGDNLKTFNGFEGAVGTRNSPTIINSGYYKENFWDGRAKSLEEQALGPIQSEVEMNQDLDELVNELMAVPKYVSEFENVFDERITIDNIAKAIAAFERTIVVTDTPFDQYLLGDNDAITSEAKEGMELFAGKASCISCHAGPLLSDHNYYNTGISGDEGRFAVTGQEADRGAFRTSGLRGITQTAPYMHDGSLETLMDVVDFYNAGGGTDPNKSVLIRPLNLTEKEKLALVEFLKSLGGDVPVVETPEIP